MSEKDPWKDVEAELLKAIGHPHVAVTDLPPDTFVARFFAARAAEATQHRQKIVAKDETIRQLEMEVGLWNQWGQQNPQTLQASKLTAEITTLRAERDRLKAALNYVSARVVMAQACLNEAGTDPAVWIAEALDICDAALSGEGTAKP